MDSQTRKALVRKRAAVKARMTHIKKYIESLPHTVCMHDVNVRLQLLEKVWGECTTVQYQLEYDDDEMQQHELDREAVTETYCELRARIDRIISKDRRIRDVNSAETQKPRTAHECLIAAAHVKSLLSLPVINNESATDLRASIDQFQSNLNATEALNLSILLHEVLSQILIEHVDEVTRKQWEMKAVSQGMTELEAILKFLEGKC
jgi:hypothetical protein